MYIPQPVYDSRYKQADIKEELEKICHKKCAYCEKDIRDSFPHIKSYNISKFQ
jgi:hypothetical protein